MCYVWVRMVGIKGGCIDFWELKCKIVIGKVVEEKFIDVILEVLRIVVFYEVIVNCIIDNFVNVFKLV